MVKIKVCQEEETLTSHSSVVYETLKQQTGLLHKLIIIIESFDNYTVLQRFTFRGFSPEEKSETQAYFASSLLSHCNVGSLQSSEWTVISSTGSNHPNPRSRPQQLGVVCALYFSQFLV